jgi:hypothetical protein
MLLKIGTIIPAGFNGKVPSFGTYPQFKGIIGRSGKK